MARQLTLKEIGKACGVSHITVSRALRGDPSVEAGTAERIRAYTDKVGYKPNGVARMLAAGRSGDVHLVSTKSIIVPYNEARFTTASEDLFWDYVEGAVSAASQTKSSIEVMGFGYVTKEFDFIRSLVEEDRIVGVLDFRLRQETIDYLHSRKVPVVSRLQSVRDIQTRGKAAVYPDHIQGYLLAWNYLASRNHQRVGYLVQEGDEVHLDECIAASQLTATKQSIEAVVKVPRHPAPEVIFDALTKEFGSFASKRWPTVLLCSNDEVAHRAIVGLSAQRISVPADLSIFGFDDSRAAQYCNPPICTVRNPRKKIGESMLWLLKDIINGRPGSRDRIEVLPMELAPRRSVRAL